MFKKIEHLLFFKLSYIIFVIQKTQTRHKYNFADEFLSLNVDIAFANAFIVENPGGILYKQ
jgi:hypothetical protein